jgi:hypothetical protein
MRKNAMSKNYLLRDIPEKLMMALKHRAVDEGRTIRIIVIRALERYLGVQREREEKEDEK